VSALQGSSGASTGTAKARTTLIKKIETLTKRIPAPMVAMRFKLSHPLSGKYV
jgi:hypothetical protein